jgi:predicted RNase H-like nuclease (RuvC/YqgF family)
MSNIFFDSVKKDNVNKTDDDYISLNDTSDLTRLAYSNKSSDIPLRNSSLTDRFESDTFINHKESFESNNTRINDLNEEIRELKMKCREIYEKDEMIVSLQKECSDLKDSLNDYEKCKGENDFLRKENSRLKDEIKSKKTEINKRNSEIKEEPSKDDKIDVDIDKIRSILSNRLKDTHEKHIDDLIKEYNLDDCKRIDKSVMEELLYKAIHL